MAEYYAVLKKAVGGLDPGLAEARRTVYDKARNALIGQLKAIDPPLAASEISRQRLELEEAIRRVERETVAAAQGARRTPPAETTEPAPSIGPEPVTPSSQPAPPPQQSAQPSAQDIFRRAIQEAEARGSAAGRAPERSLARPLASSVENEAIVEPQGNWARGGSEHSTEASETGSAGELSADYDVDQQSRNAVAREFPEPFHGQRGRSHAARQQPRAEYLEEEFNGEALEKPARRSRLSTILLFVLIVAMIGGIGALAWSQRAVITDLIASFDRGHTDGTEPEAVPALSDNQSKSADAISSLSSDSSAKPVGNSAVPVPPGVHSDAIADAIAGTPPATSEGAVAGPKAVLYEERLDAAAATGVVAIDASVEWRFVQDSENGPEISADIEVPERKMTVNMVIRRNTDPTLPASHLVEATIKTPPDFPGKGIRSVPRLVLKDGENERGTPLIGAGAKVADGYFWIALSAAEEDVAQNLKLLKDRSWIDLQLVYETGQRAILTFDKGPQGVEVFDNAFAAWSSG